MYENWDTEYFIQQNEIMAVLFYILLYIIWENIIILHFLLQICKCTFLLNENKTKNFNSRNEVFPFIHWNASSLIVFLLLNEHEIYRVDIYVCLKSSRKLEISSHNVSHDILFLENCCVCCVLFSLGKTFVWTEDIIPVKKIGENVILLQVSHNYAPYRCWVTSCICKHQTSIQVFSKLKYTTTYICSWQVVHTLVYAWNSGIYLVTSNGCIDKLWGFGSYKRRNKLFIDQPRYKTVSLASFDTKWMELIEFIIWNVIVFHNQSLLIPNVQEEFLVK